MQIDVLKIKNVAGNSMACDFVIAQDAFAAAGDLPVDAHGVHFVGEAKNIGRPITVTGTLTATLLSPCDRCGEPASVPIEASFAETFSSEPAADAPEDGDEQVHAFEGVTIDLLPYIERALFLELPMKILCREDCAGLCPKCGHNLNEGTCDCDTTDIDPRLAVLEKLLTQSSENSSKQKGE